jgi:hypothetical protein
VGTGGYQRQYSKREPFSNICQRFEKGLPIPNIPIAFLSVGKPNLQIPFQDGHNKAKLKKLGKKFP